MIMIILLNLPKAKIVLLKLIVRNPHTPVVCAGYVAVIVFQDEDPLVNIHLVQSNCIRSTSTSYQ